MKYFKKIAIYSQIEGLIYLLRKINVKIDYFFFFMLFSAIAAFFNIIMIMLMFPFTRCIIKGDLNALRTFVLPEIAVANLAHFFNSPIVLFSILVFLLIVSAIIKHIFGYVAALYKAYQAREIRYVLTNYIFNRYLSFGKEYFDQNNKGILGKILTGFTSLIADQVKNVMDLFNWVIFFIVSLSAMLIISWKLTIFFMIFFPLINYFINKIIIKIKNTSNILTRIQKICSKKIYNLFSCLSLIKICGMEEKEKKHFGGINAEISELFFKIDKRQSLIQPFFEIFLFMTVLLLSLTIFFIRSRNQALEISNFLIFFYLAKVSMDLMKSINSAISKFAKIEVPIADIQNVISDGNKPFIEEGRKPFDGLKQYIVFNNLYFSYVGNIQVLNGISFSVEKGGMTAIVGPTGAGKTTLINLLARFYNCPPGVIMIDGVDIREFSLKSLRSHMSFVTQDVLLFNDTLKNNITYGLENVSRNKLIDVAKKTRLLDFIMTLPDKFDTIIGDGGIKLSGGEKQRVSIARALIRNSEILILDEATSHLDTETERLIQDAIYELAKGKTTIVIAHRLSTIKNADKIIVIEKGRVAEQGTLLALLDQKGRFYQYWQMQSFLTTEKNNQLMPIYYAGG